MVGIDIKNKHTVRHEYTCFICALIIQNPIQFTKCGHRLCQSCLNIDIQHVTTIRCPYCLTEHEQDQLMIDQGFKRDMQSLPIECFLCNWAGTLNTYHNHLEHHHPRPRCQFCNLQCNSVHDLNKHQVLQCQNSIVECLLEDFGCSENINHGQISDHYSSRQHENSLEKYSPRIQLQLQRTRESSVQEDTSLSHSTNVVPADLAASNLRELCEFLSILICDEKILRNDKRDHLNRALLWCQKTFPKLKPSFFRMKTSVQEMIFNENILNQRSITLRSNIDISRRDPPDGTLIWKITNFKEKLVNSTSVPYSSIDSTPFYSSSIGYKMRARLYLNGNGNGRHTHLSLFCVLMQGSYDRFLNFPFHCKVTFCMYDQSGAGQHIIDSFRPDIKSNSFQRPRSEMNIGSGILKFFPLAMIEQEGNPYVRNDTMVIKMMIE